MTVPSPDPVLGGWDLDMSSAGSEWQAATPAQQQAATYAAVRTVWSLSGRQFGYGEVLLAPWVPYTPPAVLWNAIQHPWRSPYLLSRLDRSRRLLLPGPVKSLTAVLLNGVELVSGTDFVLETTGHLIKRTGAWPSQDLNWPWWTVRYLRGCDVPADGLSAAAHLAEQLVKAHAGSGTCTLPTRTREIVRQGVTVQVAAPEDLSVKGLVGVKEVDDFIVGANPFRQSAPPTIWSPELGNHRFLDPATDPAAVAQANI